ncbi:Yqey-like protein [Desulfonema limicola]|uniref:Yqey-like protein n=1 Tax=Desulfonema limicola TaxID=45656 RepID=A0A975GH83_9BACT|nr:GatB/YqeY domain-containing protein [Desulfonema limicola]QTA81135.1 Yqey-like protein [Desulfonema limicola]
MTLQEKIKNDLKLAMKAKDEDKKNTIRVIMGEFARLETKEISDEDVIKVLKKLIKSEKETLEISGEASGKKIEESAFIRIIEEYLPKMASEQEIKTWVENNIDFSSYKNKMQAMRDIMAHFGSAADGNTVKNILQGLT